MGSCVLPADVPCLRCAVPRRIDVECLTDDDLVPGSTHEVIADAYCDACLARWIADENTVALAHLIAAIDRGDVVARRADDRTVLPAMEIPRLAMAATVDGAIATLAARLAPTVVLVSDDDMWPELHYDHICARLVERGWPPPGDQLYRDDLLVRVTPALTLELA